MTSTTLPSGTGIVTSYTYDDADRLTEIEHVKDGSTTLASVAYTLDDVGNRTQRVDQQGTHTYAYDDLYRLTSVTYPGPSTTTYAFDAFGNREEMTTSAGTTSYTYDDADRVTEVQPPSPAATITYGWDDNGNLVERGADEFAWDYEDRMVEATVNSVTTTFAYRGDGLRDSRTVGMATTTFTWDINAGLPVVLDDGNQYVYGTGLSSMKQGGNWYYYLADGLGSTMAIVDASGDVENGYTYDVYGEPTVTGSLGNEFDFAGQQTDPSTGLQYLRARYYDPVSGTFISREPLATSPAWLGNPTAYAAGSPALMLDPDGLRPVDSDGCQVSSPVCARRPDYHLEGQEYTCSEIGCGWEFRWNFVPETLHSYEKGVFSWGAWGITNGGQVIVANCTFTAEQGRQCSPIAETSLASLIGEYPLALLEGCLTQVLGRTLSNRAGYTRPGWPLVLRNCVAGAYYEASG